MCFQCTPKVSSSDDLKESHSYRCRMVVVLLEILYFGCRASYYLYVPLYFDIVAVDAYNAQE